MECRELPCLVLTASSRARLIRCGCRDCGRAGEGVWGPWPLQASKRVTMAQQRTGCRLVLAQSNALLVQAQALLVAIDLKDDIAKVIVRLLPPQAVGLLGVCAQSPGIGQR